MPINAHPIIEERKQRMEFLLGELHYEIVDSEAMSDSFSATFQDSFEFTATYFVDAEGDFLEISFVFCFTPDFQDYIRDRMEEVLETCYEFGVYINIENSTEEIVFSVFSKIYYSGLNYDTLMHTLNDFKMATENLTHILDIQDEIESSDSKD